MTFNEVQEIRRKRCYSFWTPDNPIVDVQIHGFCDASIKAYGACAYLRIENKSGDLSCELISSKSRVAPIKKQTIPRLELMGALVLTELLESVKNELNDCYELSKVVAWIDSTVAYYWITNDKKYTKFIQNRKEKIVKVIKAVQWKLVNTKSNPADIVSRGMSPFELNRSESWFCGPGFLTLPETQWPQVQLQTKEIGCLEVSETCSNMSETCLNLSEPCLDRVVSVTKYSTLSKLIRVTTIVFKFIKCLKNSVAADSTVRRHDTINLAAESTVSRQVGKYRLRRRNTLVDQQAETLVDQQAPSTKIIRQSAEVLDVKDSEGNQEPDDDHNKEMDDLLLRADEVKLATDVWIKYIQKQLINNKKRYAQLSKQLNTFVDNNGIVRCRGRLENTNLPYNVKYPILIPRDGAFTRLLIANAHEKVFHQGTKATLAELRATYWIPSARSLVKSFIHQCYLCKYFAAKPYAYPREPPLPKERVTLDFPFKVTGLDYLGPVYIKTDDIMYKAWISLFTCASTRAIHLELVQDNESETFIRAFRRFISRRGTPSKVITDNASTFTSIETQTFATNRGITWQFNPPAAPWWGGFFERMVQQVKRCLRKILFRARVTYDEMATVLTEVENILNNRPLTCTFNEMSEEEMLTPNHLLYGRRLVGVNENTDHVTTDINVRHEYLETLITHFWNRWYKEYLSELREKHVYGCKKDLDDVIQIGDVVLIKDDKQPRSKWRIGVVSELFISKDKQIRTAMCKVNSNGKTKHLKRCINLLCPLETSVKQ